MSEVVHPSVERVSLSGNASHGMAMAMGGGLPVFLGDPLFERLQHVVQAQPDGVAPHERRGRRRAARPQAEVELATQQEKKRDRAAAKEGNKAPVR